MKRVILFIGIMSLGLITESQLLAQRRGNDRRDDDRKRVEKGRDNDRGRDGRNWVYTTTRNGRNERVVKKTVVRHEGYRHMEPRRDSRSVRVDHVYYDYDFRNGRRHEVRRGYAPSARHIWVNGYWHYDRRLRREVWIGGHWALRKSYHRWEPGRYSIIGGVRIWVPGVWIRVF